MNIPALTWSETDAEIDKAAAAMSAIHAAFPKKEQRAIRDKLCQPWRDLCIALHYRRIEINASRTVTPSRTDEPK